MAANQRSSCHFFYLDSGIFQPSKINLVQGYRPQLTEKGCNQSETFYRHCRIYYVNAINIRIMSRVTLGRIFKRLKNRNFGRMAKFKSLRVVQD